MLRENKVKAGSKHMEEMREILTKLKRQFAGVFVCKHNRETNRLCQDCPLHKNKAWCNYVSETARYGRTTELDYYVPPRFTLMTPYMRTLNGEIHNFQNAVATLKMCAEHMMTIGAQNKCGVCGSDKFCRRMRAVAVSLIIRLYSHGLDSISWDTPTPSWG